MTGHPQTGWRGATLFAVALSLFLSGYAVSDFDTFWHLANGRAMVENGGIVSRELFSYSAPGTRFENHAWLAQILMYLAWAAGGATGLMTFKLGIVALIVWASSISLRRYGVGPWSAALYLAWMVAAGLYLFTERPNLFSLLFLAVLLSVVEAHRIHAGPGRVPWVLVPMFVLWDVLHGSIYGALFLAVYCAGALADEARACGFAWRGIATSARLRQLFTAALLIVVAGVVNPWGLPGSAFFAELLSDNTMVANVGEFQRTPWLAAFLPFWITWFIAGAVAVVALRRRDVSSALLIAAFGALAWRYSRATAPFCIVAVPIIARYAQSEMVPRLAGLRRLGAPAVAVLLVGVVIGAVIYKLALPRHVNSLGAGINPDFIPAATVKFLDANRIGGNMFNSGELGGYLAFAAPQRKIFLYNHHTVFGPVLDSLRMPGAARRWNFSYALLGNDWRRYRFVFPIEEWAPVYWEPATMLLVRRGPEHQALIDAHEISYFSPQYDAAQLRELAGDPNVFPELLREIADYLNFRADAEIAAAFAGLIALPHQRIDVATRAELIRRVKAGNPDFAPR
jgi:hypothetical protein